MLTRMARLLTRMTRWLAGSHIIHTPLKLHSTAGADRGTENHMIWKALQVPRNPRSPCNAMHVRNTMPWSKEKCPWRVFSSFDPRTYKRKFISPLWYWWNPSLELLICCTTSKRCERNNFTAHNCHGKTKNVTAKTKTSRQNQKPHGKIKISHDKTKNLTEKPKTSRQKVFCFCREVFGFAVIVVGHHTT